MKSKKVFFWACDYSANSGEGRLGRLFIKDYKQKFKIITKRIKPNKLKILNFKYISPFIGVFIGWVYFFRNKNFLYLNYLPYWNFLILLLLPPKSIIGPITGGAIFSKKSNDYNFRKFIFPIFYYLSGLILRIRFNKLIFSTDLLKEKLSKKNLEKSNFNYVFRAINKKKNRKKYINFLFYYRKHKNKENTFPHELVKKILDKKYLVHIIGDKLNCIGVKNYGYIGHNKVLKLLTKTRYSIVSSENIFSFFTIDAINNNVKLLVDKETFSKIKYYKKNFIKFNFNYNNLKNLKIKKCQ